MRERPMREPRPPMSLSEQLAAARAALLDTRPEPERVLDEVVGRVLDDLRDAAKARRATPAPPAPPVVHAARVRTVVSVRRPATPAGG